MALEATNSDDKITRMLVPPIIMPQLQSGGQAPTVPRENVLCCGMQWETATPVGFPVCVRHNDCITWFQTQLILTTCQIRYHSHLWDHRSTGQL